MKKFLITLSLLSLSYVSCAERLDYYSTKPDPSPLGGAAGSDGNDSMGSSAASGGLGDCDDGSWSESGIEPCLEWTACEAGEFVSEEGSAQGDRQCEPCENAFSTKANSEQCEPWQTCGPIYNLAEEGTSVTDRSCSLPTPYLASVGPAGTRPDGPSVNASLSGDGRYVVFESDATNLVPDDTNGFTDIFIHDTRQGETKRVNLASDGSEANGDSASPTISSDGRYVAFHSRATNLVAGDTNSSNDVFVHDLDTGNTMRASVTTAGTQATGGGVGAILSGDGSCVVFESISDDLVPSDTNDQGDIFVHDIAKKTTTRVTVSSQGEESNGHTTFFDVSEDCRFVTFSSFATTLITGDENEEADVFLRDLEKATTVRVSATANGTAGNNISNYPSISPDGRYVSFSSTATNLVPGDGDGVENVFLVDLKDSKISILDTGSDSNLSNFGLGFLSLASDLVPGDDEGFSDAFYRSFSGDVVRLSVNAEGDGANQNSSGPTLSANGNYAVLHSSATNLVSNDDGAFDKVYIFAVP